MNLLIIGGGRAGLTLAIAACTGGRPEVAERPIAAVTQVCRNDNRRARIAAFAQSHGIRLRLAGDIAVAGPADVVVFATADRDIAAAAAQAASAGAGGPNVWLHLSGVASLEALQVAGGAAHIGSCHPLCAIPDPLGVIAAGGALHDTTRPLRGAFFAVAGDERAQRVATDVARHCGGRPAPVPLAARDGYHAAAALVANDLVALLDVGERLCMDAGLERLAARRALIHLARTAVDALESASLGDGCELADGLTGAVGRGDAGTLGAHLRALADDPKGRRAHALLSSILLELVASRLSPERNAAVARALSGG